MKIFITGGKQVGKSTLIQTLIRNYEISICGFLTLPVYENDKRFGFYFHSLVDIENNNQIFALSHETNCSVIPHIFDTIGVESLEKSMDDLNRIMILDEIGRLEKKEVHFIKTLMKCIDTYPNIIGVLKKCNISYIEDIKNRSDVIMYDLDVLDYDYVYHEIESILKEIVYEKVI